MVCTKCKVDKPTSEFFRYRSHKSGYDYQCKECVSIRQQKYYWNNHDRCMGRGRRQYEKHKEKSKARNAKWEKDNSEKRLEYRKMFPDRMVAYSDVKNAIRRGEMQKDPCSRCGATKHIHGHHEDYSKTLDVVWLCIKCHSEVHRANEPNPKNQSVSQEAGDIV